MIQTIINNGNFSGKYVAIKSFKDHAIIGDGSTPQEALKKAEEGGYKNPVITFVPVKGMAQIY